MKDGDLILVLGIPWKVVMDTDTDLELADNDQWATADSKTKEIKIRTDCIDPHIILHEIIHIVDFAFLQERQEEDHVQMQAIGLRDVFINNPQLKKEVFG